MGFYRENDEEDNYGAVALAMAPFFHFDEGYGNKLYDMEKD